MTGLSIELNQLIPILVDSNLDRNSSTWDDGVTVSQGISLGFSTTISAPYNDDVPDPPSVYIDLQFLFYGHTSVWAASNIWSHTIVCPGSRDKTRNNIFQQFGDVPLDRWINTSNHDSCWRSDGLRIIWESYIKVIDLLRDSHPSYSELAPRDFNTYARSCFGSIFNHVQVATCVVPKRLGNSIWSENGLLWVMDSNANIRVGDANNVSHEQAGKQERE